MKLTRNSTFLILIIIISSSLVYAINMDRFDLKGSADEDQTDLQKIEHLIDQFFVALENKDTATLRSYMIMNAALYSYMSEKGVKRLPHLTYLDMIGKETASIKERIWNQDIHIHKGIASVWTNYDFYRNGKLSHCGKNLMNLIKQDNNWKIADVYFTFELDCEESPLGPYFEE